MKILALSHLFPNKIRETQGLFVLERLRHMAGLAEVRIVAPVPWFPFTFLFSRYSGSNKVPPLDFRGGMEVTHPRYLVLPGLHVLTAICYALSLLLRPSLRARFRAADIIDVHWTFPDAFAGALLAAWFRKPFTVTIRGHEAFYAGQGRLRESLIRACLRRAAGVIAVSEELRQRVLDVTGIAPGKVRTVSNGVDMSRFRPLDKAACRGKLGLAGGVKMALSVGRVSPGKGFHFLLEAWPGIVRLHPGAVLAIVGEADPEGGQAYFERLRAQAEQLGISGSVLYPGKVAPEDLAEWYAACDCYCLASVSEGSPNVVLEALACGRPVIATAVGDVGEILADPGMGMLVDPAAPDFYPALSLALSKGWSEVYIFGKMKARGWNRCAENAVAAIGGFLV